MLERRVVALTIRLIGCPGRCAASGKGHSRVISVLGEQPITRIALPGRSASPAAELIGPQLICGRHQQIFLVPEVFHRLAHGSCDGRGSRGIRHHSVAAA